jgi:hypothetical protein
MLWLLGKPNLTWPIELPGPGSWRTLTLARPAATAFQSTSWGEISGAPSSKLASTW